MTTTVQIRITNKRSKVHVIFEVVHRPEEESEAEVSSFFLLLLKSLFRTKSKKSFAAVVVVFHTYVLAARRMDPI